MKILVVSTWLPFPPDNGSRERAHELLRRLTRRHRVTLLAFGDAGVDGAEMALRAMCEEAVIVPRSVPMGGRLGLRGLLTPVPRYFVQTHSARMQALVDERVAHHEAAVALQVDAAVYLAHCRSVPRVFEEAELGAYRAAHDGPAAPWRRLRSALTARKAERFVTGLIATFERSTVVSAVERDYLVALGADPERIAVVPNGTRIGSLPSVRARRRGQIIYPGSVTYGANLDAVRYFVHDVLPRVRRVRPDARLVVTGSTDGADLAGLSGQDGVEFTGRLPAIDTLVAESEVCVVPLRIGGGTRLKVLKAMALGTPVVSTPRGIEGLEVEAERHLLVGADPPALADRVLAVLDDPARGAALAAEAHRLVSRIYDWERVGDLWEQVIEGIVRRGL